VWANSGPEEPITLRLEQPAPGTVLLAVGGEVDMLSSPPCEESVAAALAGGYHRMIIDLEHVEFLGTSGLAALVEARAIAQDRSVELWLVCFAPPGAAAAAHSRAFSSCSGWPTRRPRF